MTQSFKAFALVLLSSIAWGAVARKESDRKDCKERKERCEKEKCEKRDKKHCKKRKKRKCEQ